ncbi:serine/threonine-protein kinase AFC1-like isoform X1 [Iris pallida]|uniref:dual-specificity kinase n=1 Tax=Iris pallida TaxID=29817 RepID=A0AAX6EL52_IRIPA|nr:serine/threonine-protein kinase AFC1-like isoform X1 [Iris pallida]
METQWVAEYPHAAMEKRPRKRPRLTWDMPPPLPSPKGPLPLYCGLELMNGSGANHLFSSYYYPGVSRNASPPWRGDDKDGHYVFAVGENLSARYRILSKMGEVMHDLRLIHTDLKPENILLVSSEYIKIPDYKFVPGSSKDGSDLKNLPKSSAIKLIDFGSTTFEHQDHNYVVSTRHYRAPEVILGLEWNYPCDLWSIGCILVELCSGEALFQTHENLEHLAMMERVLGPLPQHMMSRADRRAEKYFRRGVRLDWPEGATSRESMRAVWKLPRLQNLVMQHVDHSAGDLIDLLQGLLRYEPSERLKAREALHHSFFTRDARRLNYPM